MSDTSHLDNIFNGLHAIDDVSRYLADLAGAFHFTGNTMIANQLNELTVQLTQNVKLVRDSYASEVHERATASDVTTRNMLKTFIMSSIPAISDTHKEEYDAI